ncbi:MAG: ferredoxin--NADP reductase [Planctomycetes bacterium]|nr:ferredoxin--NADP reductase [Planctomycetota bacterium]
MITPDPHAANATISARRDLNDTVAIVHIRPDTGSVAPFVPGQFIQLGLPAGPDARRIAADGSVRTKLVKRSYSIAGAPHEREAYELCLAFVEQGQLTPKLRELTVGDRLWHDPIPKGIFTMERVPYGRDLVFVATGTGIAPFVSMLRAYGGNPLRFRHFVVVHGARKRSDLAYHEELTAAARADRRVSYIPILSREPAGSGWIGLRGRVQTALQPACFLSRTGFALNPSSASVFLCGNPAMIDEMRTELASSGFTTDTPKHPGNVHFERYW